MTLEELARLVESMRHAQVNYFGNRCPGPLSVAKDWERRVDKAVRAVLHPPEPGLFDATKE